MIRQNEIQQALHSHYLWKRALIGAGIAFVLISFFLLKSDPNPEWPKLWFLRPLIIVQVAGACGGIFYHLLDHLRQQRGWNRMLIYLISLIVFVIGLWMGVVLGLDGTMWD